MSVDSTTDAFRRLSTTGDDAPTQRSSRASSVEIMDDGSSDQNELFDKQLTPAQAGTQPFSRIQKHLRDDSSKKFLRNFDPEKSNREKRKLTRKIYSETKKATYLYDEKGIFNQTEEDLCDCLMDNCPGCHFPCLRCRSNKCGHECRQNRKWLYDQIEIEGSDKIIRNKYK